MFDLSLTLARAADSGMADMARTDQYKHPRVVF